MRKILVLTDFSDTARNSIEHGHSFHSGNDDDIMGGLQRFFEQQQADLMVMVPDCYSFWREIFYSPFTKRMAFHTYIPLLIL